MRLLLVVLRALVCLRRSLHGLEVFATLGLSQGYIIALLLFGMHGRLEVVFAVLKLAQFLGRLEHGCPWVRMLGLHDLLERALPVTPKLRQLLEALWQSARRLEDLEMICLLLKLTLQLLFVFNFFDFLSRAQGAVGPLAFELL